MFDSNLHPDRATLWFLGQAGYYMRACGTSLMIDPYLSDSVGRGDPRFTRRYLAPIDPAKVRADIYIVTHDHLDHLDPETIGPYRYKDQTAFVAPRHAAKKLQSLGIKPENITVVDHGDSARIGGVEITGIFALGTSADVVDTAGYLIRFPNGRTVYHSADTAYCQLLLDCCPHPEVTLVCINGKYGNLNVAQAIELAKAAGSPYVIPNHYDVMELNGENPETFRYFCEEAGIGGRCRILRVLEEFQW